MSCPGRTCTRIRTSSSSVPWNTPSNLKSKCIKSKTEPSPLQCVILNKSGLFFFFLGSSWYHDIIIPDLRLQTREAAPCPPPGLQHQPHMGWGHLSSPSSPDQASRCGWAAQTQMSLLYNKGSPSTPSRRTSAHLEDVDMFCRNSELCFSFMGCGNPPKSCT